MILATSQVANTVANLKSRYYKYLETLCSSNGIEIGTLKTNGSDYEELEMYFGGLPVLIGLKYFERLRCLRLFGQDIVNLKPLVEVSNSLEELWVCEGPLKDLAGIEVCKKLQKLYLFDCKIEDGSQLGKLIGLDTLWIMNNNLKDLEFLDHLQQLIVLYIGGKQFNDSSLFFTVALTIFKAVNFFKAAMSVQIWPYKIQELDIGGNEVKSFQSILPLSSCEVIRSFNISSDRPHSSLSPQLINREIHFSWISYHFPYLEKLNNDNLCDTFQQIFSYPAERQLMDSYIHFLTSEKNYKQRIGVIERNLHKIEERLNSLVATLSKLALTVPKKEGRRELVIRMQQQSQNSLKSLKKVKRFCINYEQCLHRIQDFYFPTWRLEGSLPTSWPRELDDYETRLLEHSFKWFGTKSSDFDIKLKTAFYFEPQNQSIPYQLKRYDVEKLFFLDFDRRTFLWDLRSCVGLFDRRLAKDYREDAVRIFKDFNIFINEAPEGTRFFVIPMVKCEKRFKNFKLAAVKGELDEGDQKEIAASADANKDVGAEGDNEFASKGQIESAYWSELELSVLCLIEIQPSGSVVFEDLQNPTFFEEKLGTQVKKLKSLGIDLKIDKIQASLNVSTNENGGGGGIEAEASNLTDDFGTNDGKKAKAKKIEEILVNEISRDRWRRHPPFSGTRRLSLRDPLELALTFSKSPIFVDTIDLCNTVNSLDLSNMKITKLDGIEQMLNLSCISLANNKLTSIKKLKHLKNLQFLDLRNNNISHFDEPPEMLSEINLSDNQFIGLVFCGRLQLLTKLNVNNNRIKSLKGLESCKLLEVLQAADNNLKEKNELEILNAFPKLMVLDLTNNPVADSDDYRKKVLQKCSALLVIDCEIVPKDERSMILRKQGKALTIDFIEKAFPNFEILKTLNLRGNDFQMIALDRGAVARLQQLTEIDLSENLLENLYELIDLQNLEILNLSKNSIVTLTGTPVIAESQSAALINGVLNQSIQQKILPALNELNLSYNNLTHQMVFRMGLNLLTNLKKLILTGNHINKFDMALYDLPRLIELDLSKNEIKSIRKKGLPQLNWLNLSENKMKDLEGLATPCLEYLDISDNKIVTCSALKSISQMYKLKKLNCQGNAVIERRVYHDFVKTQVKTLELLDNEQVIRNSDAGTSNTDQLYRRLSTVAPKSLPSGSSSSNNSNGITIRDQNHTYDQNVTKWQNSNQKMQQEPIFQQGKRPIYLPPRSNLVVNQQINNALSYKNFFPEGHFLYEDGELLESSPPSPINYSYTLPLIKDSRRKPKRQSAPPQRKTPSYLYLPPIRESSDLSLMGHRVNFR